MIKKKILILIPAYNVEKKIDKVIKKIKKEVYKKYNVRILIIEDNSKDNSLLSIRKIIKKGNNKRKIVLISNKKNQGYGGVQKIAYKYAIKKKYKYVIMLHGDNQYPANKILNLINPLLTDRYDAVFGSRMINSINALKGGMPFYKFIGNIALTFFQNLILSSNLSEFHSGYRSFRTSSLQKINFNKNTNDFHFDTEILIQLVINKDSIKEISIPTFYGDEICHVNGTKYAFNVLRMTLTAKIQKISKLILTEKFNIKKKTKNYLFSYKRVDNLLKLSMKRK